MFSSLRFITFESGLGLPYILIFAGLLTLCLLNVLNSTAKKAPREQIESTSGTGGTDTGSNGSTSSNYRAVTFSAPSSSSSESRFFSGSARTVHPDDDEEDELEILENPALHDDLQGSGKVPLLVRANSSKGPRAVSGSRASIGGTSSRFEELHDHQSEISFK